MNNKILFKLSAFLLILPLLFGSAVAQKKNKQNQQDDVRVMTIPISIFTNEELENKQATEFVEAGQIIVKEDKEEQEILSIRSVSNTPLALAILIQDDLDAKVNLQLQDLKKFIRNLPEDSRVMVAYLRAGKLQVRQKFTNKLDKAADSLRIIIGSSAVAPRNPYDGVIDTLKRFEGQPTGRRAILLLSDGLDLSNGVGSSSPGLSNDLDRAILAAQRSGVAVYSIYSPATYTESGNSQLVLNGQGSLLKFSKDTGGKAFFQGTFTPVSFQPFFRDLNRALNRQFALTYLSTHMEKGYHKVEVLSTNPEVRIEHPKGYYYRAKRF
jgi:VWFA-related protein